ncbi:MAG: response regulator [Thermodesulfobacteriota bacterium]|nr:response regulator [Thermodesulfobacteriota bacterium]
MMKTPVILFVDDDPVIQKLLKTHMQRSKFDTLHAMSGYNALSIVDENHIDLIVLDIDMPQMDGFQTLQNLRTRDSSIPVIFLSCLDGEDLKTKGLELGADDYIVKPCSIAELIARIEAVLRRTRPSGLKKGEITGNTEVFSISDLLQMLVLTKRNATITLADIEGGLVVRDGKIVAARQGGFRGMDGIVRLFLLESGSFILRYDEIPKVSGKFEQDIGSLLLEVNLRIDELRESMQVIGRGDIMLQLQAAPSDFPEIEVLQDSFPMSLVELVALLQGDLEDGLNLVKRAVEKKVLST